MKKAIVFPFQIGEHFNQDAFYKLLSSTDDVLLLVNDIDFAKKVRFYQEFGISTIKKIYADNNGSFCATRECAITKSQDVINESDYEMAVELLSTISLAGFDYKKFMREEVVPWIIKSKCDAIGLKPTEIFTERDFRNKAAWLSKKMSRKSESGEDIFRNTGMKQQNGNILCKGILATFNKHLAEVTEYTDITYSIPLTEKIVIENGIRAAVEILEVKMNSVITLYETSG